MSKEYVHHKYIIREPRRARVAVLRIVDSGIIAICGLRPIYDANLGTPYNMYV